jgi:hypothetical protein
MRECLGFTQKRISELVQSGEKSWTRWETGKARPSRIVNVLLRLIYEGKVLVSDLIAQRSQGVDWWKNCHPKLSAPMAVAPAKLQIGPVQMCPGATGLPPPTFSCTIPCLVIFQSE